MGKIKKAYKTIAEAESDVEKLAPIINPKRVDVVELSHAAILWLRNN
jgi:hypothetical protein